MNMHDTIPVDLKEFGETIGTVDVTPDQLLQWRAGIRFESSAMRYVDGSGVRLMSDQVRALFQLPNCITAAELIETLTEMIEQLRAAGDWPTS
tara:strand:- start:58 stop:336 length:279 start_codon:yes stop_codon:yes gene_type:complete